jgi:hypothetical protein
MKPDWDKLMKNWNKGDRAKTSLIADVDCTSDGGKPICEEVGVRGYPTIKWGDANALEDYDGGRKYDDLKKFAKDNLKPVCSPANLDLCDDAKKKEIADLQALSADDLGAKIDEKKAMIKESEETFEAGVKELQATYERLQKEKDDAISEVKQSGLGLMQAVQAHAKKSKDEL